MNVDLFIPTYVWDLEWAKWLVRSISANLTGYRSFTLVHAGEMPGSEAEIVSDLCHLSRRGRFFMVPEREPGHMNQQVLKMSADKFVPPGGDWICFLDSDCFFPRKTRMEEIFVDGKAIYNYGDWGNDDQWRKGSERFLGRDIPYHFMRGQAMCFRPDKLPALRSHVEWLHEEPFDDYVLARWDAKSDWKYPERHGHPTHVPGKPTISEFQVMGGWVWERDHNAYEWRHVEKTPGWPAPHDPSRFVRQYWSHSGVTPEIEREMKEALE